MRFSQGKYKQDLELGLMKMTRQATIMLKQEVGYNLYDLGDLQKSLKSRKGKEWEGEIVSNEKQAFLLEFPRKPGGKPPPLDSIAGWVVRKLGMPGNGGRNAKYTDQPRETRGVIREIAKNIGERGIKTKHVITKMIQKNKKVLLSFMK